ncbi:MAG TPA: glycosyltransferase family 2 protein [Thermomicrobiales bacterium]
MIVNWNGARLLPACLEALRVQTRPADAIIVVDNGSRDASLDLLARRFPEVRVLALPRNLGMGGGTNVGIRASEGEIVVALNNDTIADPGWLDALLAPLEADPTLGATMSTMLFAHAPAWIAAAGITVHRSGLALEDLSGARYADLPSTPRPIFGPTGGAAAYRRAMLDDIGLFDPDFFMYLEDVDLAWRARLRGWSSLHIPQATIRHIYSASSGQGSPLKSFHLARNRLWTLRKCLPSALARRHGTAIVAYDLAACAYALLANDRASLRGRRAGLRGAAINDKRRAIQARRTASIAALEEWLQPAPTARALLQSRQRINALAQPPQTPG